MMFNATPGQRVTTQQSKTTEVSITLAQAGYASGAGVLLALALRYTVIAPVVRWAMAHTTPGVAAWLRITEPRFSAVLLVVAAAAPVVALFVSFCLQVLNINWPPPFQAARPESGIFAGWGRRDPQQAQLVAPEEAEVYTGRVKSIPDPAAHTVKASLLLGTAHAARNVEISLPLVDWQRLATYTRRGGRSVSIADLEGAGFSSGPQGRARAVNKALTDYRGATEKGDRGKPLIVPAFAEWIAARGYATGEDFPVLE